MKRRLKGGKWLSRTFRLAAFSLWVIAVGSFVGNVPAAEAAPRGDVPIIEARPVLGLTVGPGRKLWVFVFPARGNGKGKPPKGEEPLPVPCEDRDKDQADPVPPLGFRLPQVEVEFNIRDVSYPIDPATTEAAIMDSFAAWENVTGASLFTIYTSGGRPGPAADGNNTVGWVKIVPRSVLAATWIWTENGVVTDVDIFYNLFHKWANLSVCDEVGRFDVGNVGTHEVGHVIGLAHLEDEFAMATMYPSAPKGEVKKRTLTTGDVVGAKAVLP